VHLKSIDQIGFKLLLFFIVLVLSGCKDPKVNFYDKSLHSKKLDCLSYKPKNSNEIDKYLETLYKFDTNCPSRLELSYKSDIVCNSSFNAADKTLSSFPTAYLKLEVFKGFNLQYSYYVDLNSKPSTSDIKEAFDRLKKDILK
jgi:hypothetical protein